jgi:hypothetical protein
VSQVLGQMLKIHRKLRVHKRQHANGFTYGGTNKR